MEKELLIFDDNFRYRAENPHNHLHAFYVNGINLAEGLSSSTNLTYLPDIDKGTVVNDAGTNAVLPLADSTNAGLLSPAEKAKINTIQIIEANVKTSNSLYVSGVSTSNREIGSIFNATVVEHYNRGLINSTDTHADVALTGGITSTVFTGPNINSASGVINYVMIQGAIHWEALVNYAVETAPYYNTLGVQGTNLDGQRGPSNISAATSKVTGIYPFFYGMDATDLFGGGLYAALIKNVTAKSNKSYLMNGTVEHMYIAYDDAYGDLIQILDGSGFVQDLNDWDTQDISVTSSSLNTNWTKVLRVYKSKAKVTVVNQTYQFRF